MKTRNLIIGCDLFLDLKLYHVPAVQLDRIAQDFPSVTIHEINTNTARPVDLNAIEVYWGNRITRELIAKMPALKWIHFGSIGVNRANVPEVLERKILVTNSKGTMETAVAMAALGFILVLARGFHHCAKLQMQKALNRATYDEFFDDTHELEGQRCLIVGLGDIGKKLARVCAALGMRVSAVKNDISRLPENVDKVYRLGSLAEAVQDADYVVNLLPFTQATGRVFDAGVFSKMKKSAFFINVGRGETVNEADLIAALRDKAIAGAGLDVFEHEPLSFDSELWNLPNAVITPHIAGLSNKYWDRECALFCANLKRYTQGESLLNVVDLTRGY